jgi:enoyl-CoA hydratase
MSSNLIELDVTPEHVAIVTLNRPPVNALNTAIRTRFVAVFDELQGRDDVRVIVLTARGRVFCAGADIKEKQTLGATPGDYVRANRVTRDAFFAVLDSTKPVIAAVNGIALGAGFIIPALADMIFAAESAVFGMPEIDVGLAGGASFLQRILPPSKLRRMMLTGEHVGAAELHRLGAVEEVVPDDQLLSTALAVASSIASKSPTAVQTIRDSFSTVEALTLREGFRLEQQYTTELSRGADAEEARRAFFEKRKPVF